MENKKRNKGCCISAVLLLMALFILPALSAQTLSAPEKLLFTPPQLYAAIYTAEKININGRINEEAWETAKWSSLFTDIEGDIRPKPTWQTQMKMLWSDSCLYIAARLEEPHIWASLTRHDAVIFHDNDFEVFIDPLGTTQPYFEIEVNALNTIFDLLLPKPYRNGGSALIGWDVQGLQSAVQIQGTLNRPSDTDTGWTVEMRIPFGAVTLGNNMHVPLEGEQWRINFSRVEWDTETAGGKYIKKLGKNGRPLPEHNWVWSPQGVVNMHYPERWGYVQFCKKDTAVRRPLQEAERNILWLAYYRQKAFQAQHHRYATSVSSLQLDHKGLLLQATAGQFLISIATGSGSRLTINQDGYILAEATPLHH